MTREKVYDVAWSGNRKPGRDGKLPPVGNTVNVKEATYTNAIGSAELIGAWTDPEFDPSVRAFYYARVIEIPTPRWTAYDTKYFQITLPKDASTTTQERAYTSPLVRAVSAARGRRDRGTGFPAPRRRTRSGLDLRAAPDALACPPCSARP